MKIYILLLLWCIGNIVNAQNFKWVNTFGSSAAEFGYSVKTARMEKCMLPVHFPKSWT
jgi:hypothetical protein